jgi:hypothetical protein
MYYLFMKKNEINCITKYSFLFVLRKTKIKKTIFFFSKDSKCHLYGAHVLLLDTFIFLMQHYRHITTHYDCNVINLIKTQSWAMQTFYYYTILFWTPIRHNPAYIPTHICTYPFAQGSVLTSIHCRLKWCVHYYNNSES